jgi:pimeloyl-ACP methyl ester carboxylesterase
MESFSTTDNQTGKDISIAYSDYGSGRPVILIHGWPLSREMWEYQIGDLVDAGFRVIKYDRRGFGKSSKPWDGYNYDTFADDLNALIEHLDLMDITLVGFSMGGGEVVRYINRYGERRISKIVLIGSVTPYLLKTSDNPDGVDADIFEDIIQQIKDDRMHFLEEFGKKFYGFNMLSHPVSQAFLDYSRMLASHATSRSTIQCVIAFSQTDFRRDLSNITVPTLVIHGDADKTVPIEASGNLTAKLIPNCHYIVYEGAPHGLFYTHRGQLNRDLIQFISGALPFQHTKLGEQSGVIQAD